MTVAHLTYAAPLDSASEPVPRGGYELNQDRALDLSLTGSALAVWLVSEAVLKPELAPRGCRWCDRNAQGVSTLNALDAWGRGISARSSGGRERADITSSIFDFGVLPAALVGTDAWLLVHNGANARVLEDLTDVAEAVALSQVLTQTVKFATGRQRPFVHFGQPVGAVIPPPSDDDNVSFFSGHTSFAFSLAVSTATVATLRGYDGAWVLWTVGLPIAAVVPVLRMAADKHYFTDVLVGAVAGAGVGFAVPYLLHQRKRGSPLSSLRLGVSSQGIALSWTG